MATTITAATLTVSVTETITLNGVARNSEATTTIASVGEIFNRIMKIESSTNGTGIFDVAASDPGAGAFVRGDFEYCRITNLDDTNFIIIQFTDESSHHWELKLEAGKTLMFGDVSSIDDQADIDNFSASTITKVVGKADTADCDIEVYIASQ
tara:strand:+ start:708 stop:1166 length:459 start_codon:yes stop_codon:yes gene_type:complete